MEPTDFWIRDELWDKRFDSIALAAQFLLKVETANYVGPKDKFIHHALMLSTLAVIDLATIVWEMPTLPLSKRYEAADVILRLSPVATSEAPNVTPLIALLRFRPTDHYEVLTLSRLGEAISINAVWHNGEVRRACIAALQTAGDLVGLDHTIPSRITRRAVITWCEKLLDKCRVKERELAAMVHRNEVGETS